MTAITFLILSLAAYRLTHLLVFDKIFEPIRNLFVIRTYEVKDGALRAYFTLQGGPVRRFIGRMLNCPWCAGLWVSAAVALAHRFFPGIFWIWLILAVAGVQSLIEAAWMKLVGFPEMQEIKKESNGGN